MTPLKILFIDDDVIEAMKLQRTIDSLKLKHQLIEAKNGEQALEILEQKDDLPDIILLDLNMPKINGIEFLSIIKKSDRLNYLPTIVFTTSSNEKDLMQCYKLGIAGYIIKPLKYSDYVLQLQKLLEYWSINQLIKK